MIDEIKKAKRVMILGSCCSGKSTLGLILAEAMNIQVFHMDQIAWKNSKWLPPAEILPSVSNICEGPAWILEGMGPAEIQHYSMSKTDLVILIDIPQTVVFWQFCKRFFTSEILRREIFGVGDIHWAPIRSFRNQILFIRSYYRNKVANQLLKSLENHGKDAELIHIKSGKELKTLIAEIQSSQRY